MASEINWTEKAQGQLQKLDKPIARRIADYMDDRVAPLEDPRSIGHALSGPLLGTLWTYRIGGGYRAICDIQDTHMRVLVIEVGDRKHVYEKAKR